MVTIVGKLEGRVTKTIATARKEEKKIKKKCSEQGIDHTLGGTATESPTCRTSVIKMQFTTVNKQTVQIKAVKLAVHMLHFVIPELLK